jgi:hypothetical protein
MAKAASEQAMMSDTAADGMPDYELIEVSLVSSELTTHPEEDGEQEAHYYTVSVDEPLRIERTIIHFCQLVAGKKIGDASLEVLKATYVFGFTSPEDLSIHPQFKGVVQRAVISTVWPRFCDLFALMVSQANLGLPQLPLVPDKIEFEADEGQAST